jgi:hypothetical protein
MCLQLALDQHNPISGLQLRKCIWYNLMLEVGLLSIGLGYLMLVGGLLCVGHQVVRMCSWCNRLGILGAY